MPSKRAKEYGARTYERSKINKRTDSINIAPKWGSESPTRHIDEVNKITKDVADYLANGGTITQIPNGQSGYNKDGTR